MSSSSFITRIDKKFAALKEQNKKAFVAFVTAGDPDFDTSLEIVKSLPGSGADIIEIGMPFSDPMADGPAIQLSSQRALKNGHKMEQTLEVVKRFREADNETPIVLMGYYNPIYRYPVSDFLSDISEVGVDGLIIVDLPPEADEELCIPAMKKGINFIRLATPTTDEKRLPTVLQNTSGFVYYVSIAGITGTKAPDPTAVKTHVGVIKSHTDLPVVVGFGVKTAEQARDLGNAGDGVVVGSALVNELSKSLDKQGNATSDSVHLVTNLAKELSNGLNNT